MIRKIIIETAMLITAMILVIVNMNSASAIIIHEGDVYTQQQYDTVNFTTLDLSCAYHNFTVKPLINTVYFKFSCLSARKQTDGNYFVFRKYREYPLSIKLFLGCVIREGVPVCIEKHRVLILSQFYADKKVLRTYLESMQTHILGIDQNDVVFTEEELDEG
jgi:hypothetical protein